MDILDILISNTVIIAPIILLLIILLVIKQLRERKKDLTYFYSGEYKKSLEYLLRKKQNKLREFLIGICYLLSGNNPNAERYLVNSLKLGIKIKEVHLFLIFIYIEIEKPEKIRGHMKRLISEKKTKLPVLYHTVLSYFCYKTQETKRAYNHFAESIKHEVFDENINFYSVLNSTPLTFYLKGIIALKLKNDKQLAKKYFELAMNKSSNCYYSNLARDRRFEIVESRGQL